jgi:hypothetical protein
MTGLEILQKELRENIDARRDALAQGRVADYAEYRQIVGVLTGLTSALNRVNDLLDFEENN